MADIGNTINTWFSSCGRLVAVSDAPLISMDEVPAPASLAIEADDVGFFLYRLDEDGSCAADTWHLTLEEAKAQAEFEYAVAPTDWTSIA